MEPTKTIPPAARVPSAPPSPAHLAEMATRRAVLRTALAQILPSGGGGPIVWEIGSGHGHFLTAYAAAHPQELCLGIDIVGERIERANRKRDRAKLANLHFLHAEARLFLEVLPAAATFSRIFVLFPDPWPKLRHHKHRIMQPDFLGAVAKRAGQGTRLYFRTDYAPYYEDTLSVFRQHPQWMPLEDGGEAWPFEQETVFQSRAPSYQSVIAGLRATASARMP